MFIAPFATAQDYVDDLVRRALAARASDIHVERKADEGLIRVRSENVLRDWAKLPLDKLDLLIRRLKFISSLDPEHSGRAQEGRFEFLHNNEKIAMRLSVLPTAGSDDIVIRLLGSSPERFGLKDLSFAPAIREGLEFCVQKSSGLIVVTGPTGSGKTSTLYAAVQELNDGSNKIITVEDPIEYKVPGLTQIKIDAKKGVTYTSTLRTVLRHDPDVILVGEVRNLEEAEIAVEASMTGHLVLTTLHTNSAAGAILRLVNLGIPAIDVSNALTATYAQRLLRLLCPQCKVEAPAPKLLKDLLGPKAPAKVFEPKGCEHCGNTGYKGRVPVGELIIIDDDFRDAIIASPNLNSLNKLMKAKNIKSLADYALDLVAEGKVSFKDVMGTVL
ncbi:MAG: GspE/PulE family protein [Dongiaceae bacterium]